MRLGIVHPIGLPGTDVNLGPVLVTEVPQHEQITIVFVDGAALEHRLVALPDQHTEIPFDGRMLDHFHRSEGHVDRLGIGEDVASEPVKVLLLGILRLGTFRLHLDAPFAFLALDDLSRDDQGVVAEHHFQEVDVLFLVGRPEILDIIQDNLTLPQIGHL